MKVGVEFSSRLLGNAGLDLSRRDNRRDPAGFRRDRRHRCFDPTLWKLEVANGLTLAVRRGRVTPGFRADALRLLLADRFGLTLNDAAYLELAQRLSLPLASLDLALRDAGQALRLSLIGL